MYCYTFTGKTSQTWNEEAKQYVTAFNTYVCPFYFQNKLGLEDQGTKVGRQ